MIVMSNLLDQGHRFEQEDDGKLLVGASRRRVDLPPSIIVHRTSLGHYLDDPVVVVTSLWCKCVDVAATAYFPMRGHGGWIIGANKNFMVVAPSASPHP